MDGPKDGRVVGSFLTFGESSRIFFLYVSGFAKNRGRAQRARERNSL